MHVMYEGALAEKLTFTHIANDHLLPIVEFGKQLNVTMLYDVHTQARIALMVDEFVDLEIAVVYGTSQMPQSPPRQVLKDGYRSQRADRTLNLFTVPRLDETVQPAFCLLPETHLKRWY
jgi:hypothetical protein